MSSRDIVMAAASSAAAPLTWTYQDNLSQSQTIFGISSANAVLPLNFGGYLAVGNLGRAAITGGGGVWDFWPLRSSGFTGSAFCAAKSNTTYCVGGIEGYIATSENAISWTLQTGLRSVWGTTPSVRGLVHNGSVFMAVGTAARAAYSVDGVTWTLPTTALGSTSWGSANAFAVAWNGSTFCVVGAGGRVATSPTGAVWTYQGGLRSTTWGTSANANAVAWNGSVFCVVGGSGRVATSPDGVMWTYRTGLSSTTWGTAAAWGICWTGSMFVVVGDFGRVATSPDGVTWTYQNGLRTTQWDNTTSALAVAYSTTSPHFCVVGANGQAAVSDDAVTWTSQDDLSKSQTVFNTRVATSVAWSGAAFCAVGQAGRIARSFDGGDWTLSTPFVTTNQLNTVAGDGSVLGAAGDFATVLVSYNHGASWVNAQSNLTSTGWGFGNVYKIGKVFGVWAIVGGGGLVAINNSTLSGSWSFSSGLPTIWPGGAARSFVASNALVCVVGDGGQIAISYDLASWSVTTQLQSTGWGFATANDVAWSGTTFCVVGASGAVATSPDGSTWTYRPGLSASEWGTSAVQSIVWTGTQFFITGQNGYVATSPDGVTWAASQTTPRAEILAGNTPYTGVSPQLYGGAWSGTKFCVVGSAGAVATSN